MKAVAGRIAPGRLYLAGLVLLAWSGCASSEFFPAEDYPGLKRRNVTPAMVELIYQRPDSAYTRVGEMEVRDAGKPRSDKFQKYVREETARRGATGAWIMLNRVRTTPHNTIGGLLFFLEDLTIVRVMLYHRAVPATPADS